MTKEFVWRTVFGASEFNGRNIPLDCLFFFNFVVFIIVIQVTSNRVYRRRLK